VSVPVSTVQATFCATLVDEWIRAGLLDVVICPGSRSTPLALAFASRKELRCHVRIDERSAAFFAIGRALSTRRPVAVLVTSGTAAAELHAAVAEADLSRVPLLILTADRPPELRGVGAPQTIAQTELYGPMVRLFAEPGVTRNDARRSWRPLASQLWRAARGFDDRPAGPVHANLSFVEPLLGEVETLPEGRDENDPWVFAPVIPALRSAFEVDDARVLCVVGAGVSASVVQELWSLQWAVIGDATVPHTLPYADPLLRDDSRASTLRPDIVVRLGGMSASKVLAQRLREWSPRVVGFTGAGFLADPDGIVSDRLPGLPDVRATQMRGSMSFVQEWASASRIVGEHLPSALGDVMSEIAVARTVVEAGVSAGVPLVVGSSMPVRDVEWWAPSRVSPVFSNRGANGIDGVVSTALGVASGDRALGLVGDVTFLHDVSALVDGVRGTAVLVVVDNSGGGIFNFLPQASALASDQFEELFATDRHHDLVRVASSFGHHAERVTTVSELTTAISAGLDRAGLTVIVATVPSREENVAHHHALNESVATWLS